MLHVTPQLYARAASGSAPDLKIALQAAIELEHATMPPYLFALYSLGGSNTEIAGGAACNRPRGDASHVACWQSA
jgi:Ferritin-like